MSEERKVFPSANRGRKRYYREKGGKKRTASESGPSGEEEKHLVENAQAIEEVYLKGREYSNFQSGGDTRMVRKKMEAMDQRKGEANRKF